MTEPMNRIPHVYFEPFGNSLGELIKCRFDQGDFTERLFVELDKIKPFQTETKRDPLEAHYTKATKFEVTE